MNYRNDKYGNPLSILGFGCMRFQQAKGRIDLEEAERESMEAYRGGVNYFDTSPVYCRGESENALGTALAHSGYSRGDYVIATKLSNFSPTHYSLDACKRMFASKILRSYGNDHGTVCIFSCSGMITHTIHGSHSFY